jgi:hypothetical protein
MNIECSKCERMLPTSAFHRDRTRNRSRGYQYQCKACRKAYDSARKKRNMRLLDRYKRINGCSVCQTKEDLCFHHVDPSTKRFTIGASSSQSISAIKIEMRKCVVMCRSCHMTLHGRLKSEVMNNVCRGCGKLFHTCPCLLQRKKYCSLECRFPIKVPMGT